MDIIIILFYAVAGGIAVNFLRVTDLSGKSQPERDLLLKDPLYWIQFVVLPLLGAVLASAYIYSGVNLNPILAMQIGASAPLILKSFAQAIPTTVKDVA